MTDSLPLYIHLSYPPGSAGDIDFGPAELPLSWENVSNLRSMPDNLLADLGWYPVLGSAPIFDPETEYLVGPVIQSSPRTAEKKKKSFTFKWEVKKIPLEELKAAAIKRIKEEFLIARKAIVSDDEELLFKQSRMAVLLKQLIQSGPEWTQSKNFELDEILGMMTRIDNLRQDLLLRYSKILNCSSAEELKKMITKKR